MAPFDTWASVILAMSFSDTDPPSANFPAPVPAAVMLLMVELFAAVSAMVLPVDVTRALSIYEYTVLPMKFFATAAPMAALPAMDTAPAIDWIVELSPAESRIF